MSKESGSRLEVLFTAVAQATEDGDLRLAFRMADCALRIAPEDVTCLLVLTRLLIRLGQAEEAAQRLVDRQEPVLIITRGLALCELGRLIEAADLCNELLRQFALDAVEGLQEFANRLLLSLAETEEFGGWVGVDTSFQLVGKVRTGSQVEISIGSTQVIRSLLSIDASGAFDSFRAHGPVNISGQLSISASGLPLLGSGGAWPPDFGVSGWVMAEKKSLHGRIQMSWAPALPIGISIVRSGRDQICQRIVPSSTGAIGTPFSIPLDSDEWEDSRADVCALLPDGTYAPLLGSPVNLHAGSYSEVSLRPKLSGSETKSKANHVIDIVVPVFAGRDETLSCIESVLATTSREEAELVVVNDASPDLDLCNALDCLARSGRLTLLTNRTNLGFPGSANRGMSFHRDRDVVILNSDTEVFGDWLERLKDAAYRESDVGTVSPFGEAASIVSYTANHATPCTKAQAEEIDSIARKVNARKFVDLPVGVGFCMYIHRACLDAVGEFDESSFGKGYGEENDFCLRAHRLGWRHVAATDLFVKHCGARSYGRAKMALRERNGRVLNARFPGYDSIVADFVAADPLLCARRAIDIERLIRAAINPVLLVTSNVSGGVKRHVESRLSEPKAQRRTVLLLHPGKTPGRPDQVRLSSPELALENLVFNVPSDLTLLRDSLLNLGLQGIELHHFIDLSPQVIELVTSLGVRHEVYVHDYSWICPRICLADGNGFYCGEPSEDECEVCIRQNGTALVESITVRALRERSARILKDAYSVIAPTMDARARLARYFPSLTVKVTPWESAIRRPPPLAAAAGKLIRVAVIGAISDPKGYRVLLECARDAAARNLDLDFVVIGFTCGDDALLDTGRVFITGPYNDQEVAGLLKREKCQVALYPSVVPETWCYALSHSLAQGIPIIAFDLGAIAERLRGDDAAYLLPLFASSERINDTLLKSARRYSPFITRKEPVMEPASPTNLPQSADELTTSLQFVPLPEGVYTFNLRGGATNTTSTEELALPAVQVGVAPAQSDATVEFVSRATTNDRWLARSRDMIIARISGGGASLMLTSVRKPFSPVLAVDVRRLESDLLSTDPEGQPVDTGVETRSVHPAKIVAHIQRIGDVPFNDGWAGCVGDRLWIEAFAIRSIGKITPDLIEYCGVTSDGFQTPWLGNRVLCGSRGRATPIIGYAIRLKPEAAKNYDCVYSGQFVSGRVLGPFKNGDLCCSDLPRDPLWGIELHAVEHFDTGSDETRSNIQQVNAA